ncbi:hypothetical protein I79_009856 [Cricetulus griseus]|uniref:Uncharacterized protein n=1 Tax=Cricetulus griseus TaxID=10029 RepID=G3HGW4_CRIGR|nr:hypothetical protein I79_009856 [Cricetulus griseus]
MKPSAAALEEPRGSGAFPACHKQLCPEGRRLPSLIGDSLAASSNPQTAFLPATPRPERASERASSLLHFAVRNVTSAPSDTKLTLASHLLNRVTVHVSGPNVSLTE